jgi:hypothetical protein
MPDARTPAPISAPHGDTSSEELASAALAFITSLRKGPAEYAERPGGSSTLAGAALATSARYIAGPLGKEELTADREAVVEYLHSKQRASSGAYDDVNRDTPTWRRLNIPLFGWVLRALAMLGVEPTRPTNFLGRWDDPDELSRWLGLLEWHRAARQESLRVMNVGVPRVNAFKLGRHDLEDSVQALFAGLKIHQDAASGFWGPSRGGSLTEGIGATFHVLKIYEAAGQPIPRASRIAATTFDLWREDEAWGDAWSDMAALGVLLSVADSGGDIKERSRDAARCTRPFLLHPSGGRGFAFESASDAVTRLEALRSAGILADDDETEQLSKWRSAWDPALWVCAW